MLSQADVRELLDLDALLDALTEGFRALSAGEVNAPPRNGVDVAKGFLLGMPAHIAGDNIAVKMVSVFHGNHALGIPGHQALICLFDEETGTTKAVMDGTYITAMRTAGGAAVSARMLARKNARTLAIIGAGVQGEAHLKLLSRVRDFDEIRVGSLYAADAERVAGLDPRARAVGSFEEAVRGADVVCLCTTSSTPVVERAWLKEGAHVSSVGYMPPGGELAREIIDAGALYVETRDAFLPIPVGCDDLKGVDAARGSELGEVLLGKRPGRTSETQLTVYKSMGHAVEDMVAANLVYRRANELGRGTTFEI